ncbi:copper resistance protein B [uncultured Sneathiella sp.]|uniref:copper resistance protein B n=1 Tax=uncultured Sneathiella sp. TaxID=879315 RepID=UPI0030EDBCFF|tara:strand:- start:4107 stop:4832 length:726 start_codon:yes stop_codon:yes gene_type:complete
MTELKKSLLTVSFILSVLTPAIGHSAETSNVYYGVQMEELEYRFGADGNDTFVYDGDAFIGTDELKLRWQGDGELDLDVNRFESLSNQLVLQTPVSDFWDIKGGVRYTSPQGPDRWYAVVGFSGLAPQWIEVDTDLYLSDEGNVSASLDLEYETLFTNYLILTSSFNIDGAFSSDREIGVGSGINGIEAGLRLSYDVWDRVLSPYVGVVYERKFGQTANFLTNEGEEPDAWNFVIGTKLMF